ncbi:MAG: L-threonylcarbamoyladenylate synthase [Syntrophales bacterium]
MTVRLHIDPRIPDAEIVAEVGAILRAGGVVAFPTETFYGLGADGRLRPAVEKVFRLKGRTARNPLSVVVATEPEVIPLVAGVPAAARTLMHAFWPGALTLVFAASAGVLPLLTAGTGKIGIRVPSHPVARLIAQELAGPLTATSANLTGGRECSAAAEVLAIFGDGLDAVIDAGNTAGGLGSTILDVTVSPPLVLREGVVSAADIYTVLGMPFR